MSERYHTGVSWLAGGQPEPAAPKFAAFADEVHDALAELETAIRREGRCWGVDEPGRQFASGYEPGVDQGLRELADMVTAFDQIAARIRRNADEYDRQEQDNTAQFRDELR
jgi:uncharacterized protein YukE